jgi:uracil-DNA glycosylase
MGLESLNVKARRGGQAVAARPAGSGQPKPVEVAKAALPVAIQADERFVHQGLSRNATSTDQPRGQSPTTLPVAVELLRDEPFTSPMLPRERKLVVLKELDDLQVKPCRKCGLCQTRTQTVFGEGDADARVMFIGEGPGGEEDASGRPFVGRAGQLLEKMINAMGLSREQVFIANIVKCRAYHVEPSPKDRPPSPQEVAACSPYLLRQIEIIRPAVIVTLGLPSSQFLLGSKLAMGKMRGNWTEFRGLKVMPTYHPAYVLRNYTDETRALVWGDLQKVMVELGLKR